MLTSEFWSKFRLAPLIFGWVGTPVWPLIFSQKKYKIRSVILAQNPKKPQKGFPLVLTLKNWPFTAWPSSNFELCCCDWSCQYLFSQLQQSSSNDPTNDLPAPQLQTPSMVLPQRVSLQWLHSHEGDDTVLRVMKWKLRVGWPSCLQLPSILLKMIEGCSCIPNFSKCFMLWLRNPCTVVNPPCCWYSTYSCCKLSPYCWYRLRWRRTPS